MCAVWRQLDLLGTDLCRICTCCKDFHSHTQFRPLYDFLTRPCDEFEPLRAQLLARHPKVTLFEALTEVCSEEFHLHNRGILSIPSALTARISTPSSSSRPTAPPTTSKADLRCTYCKEGHLEHHCFKKKDITARRTGQHPKDSKSVSTKSATTINVSTSDTQEFLTSLRRLAASTPSGTAGSFAHSSSNERPHVSFSLTGKSPWILDSGASFHLTLYSLS